MAEDGTNTISLGITPEATYDSIAIVNLPDGVELSAGTQLPNGIWLLWPNQLTGLEMYVPANIANNTQLNGDVKVMPIQDGYAQEVETVPVQDLITPNNSTLDNSDYLLESDFDDTQPEYLLDHSYGTLENAEFLDYELSPAEQMTFHEVLGEPDDLQDTLSDGIIFGEGGATIEDSELIVADTNAPLPWEADHTSESKLDMENALFGEDTQLQYTAEDVSEAHDLLVNQEETFTGEAIEPSPIDSKPVDGL